MKDDYWDDVLVQKSNKYHNEIEKMENEAKEALKLSKKLELGYQVTSQPGKFISKDLTEDE